MNNIIIIPALNPDQKLINLVNELENNKLSKIIIVDDGSSDKTIFNELESLGCIVIHHDINKGKGRAIKTAVKEADKYFNNINGYITMDADGQHQVSDVVKISNLLMDDIILGERNFKEKNVPFRSKFGNKFSSIFFRLSTGYNLEDTQTGLRGIPYKYKDLLLNTDGDRFEYEMNFLMNIANQKIKIDKVSIKTIYESNNKGSHFSTIKDSVRIYDKFIRYTLCSISSAVIDLILFTILVNMNGYIMLSTSIARIISGIYNFTVNKIWCFKSDNNTFEEVLKYLILFIIQMLLSGALVSTLSILNINLTVIKIVVDSILFIGSYFIQKKLIFVRKDRYEE